VRDDGGFCARAERLLPSRHAAGVRKQRRRAALTPLRSYSDRGGRQCSADSSD
jgi:hypothetical protein